MLHVDLKDILGRGALNDHRRAHPFPTHARQKGGVLDPVSRHLKEGSFTVR